MCEKCEARRRQEMNSFYGQLTPAHKADAAIDAEGNRTIFGYYDAGDTAILARHYPLIDRSVIDQVARLINHPRLLEVAGLLELVHRYLDGAFSQLKNVSINVAANPLSILFWSERDEQVHRIKTDESEMLHGPMEKMALRQGSLQQINDLFTERYGIAVTYGCSCCGIAVAAKDLPALYASDYYNDREGFGRLYDSDVQTATGGLFEGVSVTEVPQWVLGASADFGQPEVDSYVRFAAAARAAIEQNQIKPDLAKAHAEVRAFLTGDAVTAAAAA